MSASPKAVPHKKILTYVGIAVALLIAFIFATPYIFADKIKEGIKKTANKRLNAKLNYSDMNISYFKHFPSLTLTLENLTLNGSPPYQNEKFISAKEVAFGINVPSLIFGSTVKIDEIYLSNALIKVMVNKQGEANYNVYISPKKKDSTQTAIKLNKIEINNSTLIYDDQSVDVHIDALGLNYLGNGDLDKDIFDLNSRAKINKLNVIYEKEPYLMNKKVDGKLITRINTDKLSFIFQENSLHINKLPIDVKGRFDFLKDGYYMNFKAVTLQKSEIGDILTAFPPKYVTWLSKTEVKGKGLIAANLKGKYISSKNIGPDLHFDLNIENGYINYQKSPFAVSNLNVALSGIVPSLNPDLLNLNIRSISLNVNQDYVAGKVHLIGLLTPEINADLKTQINLERLTRAVGFDDMAIKGMLVSNVKAQGKYDLKNKILPVTEGTVDLKNGYILTKYYPNPITNIEINGKINNQKGTYSDLSVNLKPASFTFEGNPVFVEADLRDFNDLIYHIKAKGTVHIKRIYKVFSQKGLDLDGTIKADLVLRGKQSDAEKGNYSKLENRGILEIQNIGVKSKYLPLPFVIKKGTFKFHQDKMFFNQFLAAYGKSDFTMNGYMQNVFNYMSQKNGVLRGSFTLNSQYLNIDDFMSRVDSTQTQPNASPTKTAQTETGVIIIPPNLDLQFKANAKKVDFNQMLMNNATGSLSMKNGKLTMKNTGFNLIGCTVTMNANYQAIKPTYAAFDYSIKATDFDIKRAYKEIKIFREMATSAENAEGMVSLDYKLKGKLNSDMEPVYPSLEGSGVVSVKNVKVNGHKMFNQVSKKTNQNAMKNPEISKIDIKSSVKNNIITVERFKFKYSGFRPRIEGQTSLDGKLNLKMRLGLPPFGIIGIPLRITGDSENPKIKLGKKSEDLEEAKDTIQ